MQFTCSISLISLYRLESNHGGGVLSCSVDIMKWSCWFSWRMSLIRQCSSLQKLGSSGHDSMEPASRIAENIFWNSSRKDSSWMLVSVN